MAVTIQATSCWSFNVHTFEAEDLNVRVHNSTLSFFSSLKRNPFCETSKHLLPLGDQQRLQAVIAKQTNLLSWKLHIIDLTHLNFALMINPTCKLRYITKCAPNDLLSSGRPWKCCYFCCRKNGSNTLEKKKTSTKVNIINYLLSSSRDTTTDVQIVNFEFIMWALGGDAIRVA